MAKKTDKTDKTQTTTGKSPPDLLDIDALSDLLGMSTHAVYTMHHRREIPDRCIVKIGTRLRFRSDAVAAWIDSMTAGKVAA